MQRVIDVSRNLFLEKGYSKTTIKEIIKEAEITTGSLYHFFKDKEDILLHISQDVFDLAAALSDEIVGENAKPWLRFSMEIGIQFYLILDHQEIAELYLVAHESLDIARLIAKNAQDRNKMLFQTYYPDFTPEEYYVMSLSIKGIIHSFIQEVVYNKEPAKPALIFRVIEMALRIFQIPHAEIEKTIQLTHELIKKNTPRIYGFKFPKIKNL